MRKLKRVDGLTLSAALALLCMTTAVDAQTSTNPLHLAASRLGPPLPAMGPTFRQEVKLPSEEPAGTILIRKDEKALYFITGEGKALRYAISVGREGFGWTGSATVGAKKEWPDWRPPAEMREREPGLPAFVPAGPYNPLGARAIYLYRNGADTLYRIHGTNNPDGIGFDGTSGCFRLTNTDVMDLFRRVSIGARVVVE